MNFFEKIRLKLGWRNLQSKLQASRQGRVHNFQDARSVGIVYREKGESFYILVKQYVQYLKSEHGIREVMAMCYVDDKKVVPHYHVHKLKYDFFTKAEINWRFEPTCDQVKQFANRDFDILIDFEKDPCLPLRYVVAESKAAFKVGYYHPENEPFYDMMMRTGEKATFDQYIDQVNRYLKIINTKNARA